MFTVTLRTDSQFASSPLVAEAEASTAEDALFAARTIWDDATEGKTVQGWSASLSLTFIGPDGKHVATVNTRP